MALTRWNVGLFYRAEVFRSRQNQLRLQCHVLGAKEVVDIHLVRRELSESVYRGFVFTAFLELGSRFTQNRGNQSD